MQYRERHSVEIARSRRRSVRSARVVVFTVWLMSGCMSFQTNPLSPQQAVEGRSWVRLTVVEPSAVSDSGLVETIILKNPWASDEAIGGEVCTRNVAPFLMELVFGWVWMPRYRCAGSRIIALGSIRSIETQRFDVLKTSMYAGAVVVTFGLLLALYAGGS